MGIKERILKRLEEIKSFLAIKPKLMAPEPLITAHKDGDKHTSYYFEGGKAQEENDYAHFNSSILIKEEQREDGSKSYLYRGIISGAGNAVGMIETEIPLEEIVKTRQGSRVFTKMLSKEYAMQKAYQTWDELGFEYDKSSTMRIFFK